MLQGRRTVLQRVQAYQGTTKGGMRRKLQFVQETNKYIQIHDTHY